MTGKRHSFFRFSVYRRTTAKNAEEWRVTEKFFFKSRVFKLYFYLTCVIVLDDYDFYDEGVRANGY